MRLSNNIRTVLKLVAGGGIVGFATSFLLGATAVGVLGAGIGGPAGFIFALAGIIAAFAIYGLYRILKG